MRAEYREGECFSRLEFTEETFYGYITGQVLGVNGGLVI